ncbi:3-mercaptopyruvate sulfurtransferase [Psychromonas antarctica]|uniref:3-mercaptopyruvate sulfurtransferase n=1 Tax=Psychromonas antarctica TaxID=67573 RepID=UPI001EE91862|nr:3-mercaptopyruvate sulfurtransferase [Psychromonas antarctica]MCG6200374.1 3-mercaptopyruvate sulfurtransferase [Psychromonas antarctica]
MSQLILPSVLVTTDWLHQQYHHENLILLDASWHMPNVNRDGKLEWANERLPGAVFFDFDRVICDHNSDLPHMMPSEIVFQQSAQILGINQDSVIVVYDSLGIFSSPRVWWMFKTMGFDNIAVLDGGLPAWKAAGFAIESGSKSKAIIPGDFIAHYQSGLICAADAVLSATSNSEQTIIDARSSERFLGQLAEPRAGVRSGHMPNAKNLPVADILQDLKMKNAYQLALIFEAIAPKKQRVIFSCGSGVTACILVLGATLAGYKDLSVYDGSWSEWGSRDDLPVVK